MSVRVRRAYRRAEKRRRVARETAAAFTGNESVYRIVHAQLDRAYLSLGAYAELQSWANRSAVDATLPEVRE